MSLSKLDLVAITLEIAKTDEAADGKIYAYHHLEPRLGMLIEIEMSRQRLLDAEIFGLNVVEQTIKAQCHSALNTPEGNRFKSEWMGKRANIMSALKVREKHLNKCNRRLEKLSKMRSQVNAFNKLKTAESEHVS
jgi:hypothetical protein